MVCVCDGVCVCVCVCDGVCVMVCVSSGIPGWHALVVLSVQCQLICSPLTPSFHGEHFGRTIRSGAGKR